MPLAWRVERLDAVETATELRRDILTVGIEYVVADHHFAPAQQIHRHAGPAQGRQRAS